MNPKYEALFRPIKIGGTELKNRVILCAMGGTGPFRYGGAEFDETITDYYLDQARGGVGLIIPGVTQVENGGHYLDEYPEVFRGPIRDMMDKIHAAGSKYFLQLGAGFGRVQLFGMDNPDPAVRHSLFTAPSDGIPNVWVPALKHRGLTREEIHGIVAAFGRTARLCQEAGVDGIELHAVHEGYLLDQFAVKNTNGRNDEYGGSLENRLRFACELIQEIHRVCGRDYPVAVRYSVASKMRGFNQGALPGEAYEEFGRTMEESPRAAQILEAAGADLLDADNGSYDSWWWAHPPVYMPLHCNFPEVAYLKNFVKIPVFCAGRMEDPDFSAAAIAKGEIDGISVARQFLADPDWLKKVEEDRLDEIRPCIACHNGCFPIGKVMAGTERPFAMGHCALRPATRAEKQWQLIPAEKPRKIAVVGGGVGGMEAARLLKMRGHQVTLYEKSGELGGVFIAAAAPEFKEKDRMLLDWYRRQLELLDIDVRLNTEATPELLEPYEAVVCASGSSPRQLQLPGMELPGVMQAVDYLRGRQSAGQRAVIIGGGLTGVEIAYQLALQGKKPAIVEMREDILLVPGLCAANSGFLQEAIRLYEIPVYTGAGLSAVEESEGGLKVTLKTAEGEQLLEADSVILSVGYIPDRTLAEQLQAAGKEVRVIGDARKVANLMNAVYDAYEAAFSL